MHAAAAKDKSQDHDKRIRELELQVHALTAAVQHFLIVTKPLVEIAEAARQEIEAEPRPVIIQRI